MVERAALLGVEATVDSSGGHKTLRMLGRPDALGSWARQGRRLARALFEMLLRAGHGALEGDATVALRSRKAQFRLTAEVLTILRGGAAGIGWDEAGGWSRPALWQSLDQTYARAGQFRIRRFPDPEIWKDGLILPDIAIQAGSTRALLCIVGSEQQALHLVAAAKCASLSARLIFAGTSSNLTPLAEVDARLIVADRCETKPLVEGIMAALDQFPERRSLARSA